MKGMGLSEKTQGKKNPNHQETAMKLGKIVGGWGVGGRVMCLEAIDYSQFTASEVRIMKMRLRMKAT